MCMYIYIPIGYSSQHTLGAMGCPRSGPPEPSWESPGGGVAPRGGPCIAPPWIQWINRDQYIYIHIYIYTYIYMYVYIYIYTNV